MQPIQLVLLALGLLGSMAVFSLIQRLLAPAKEEATSLTRLAPKGPGEVNVFESVNPQGSFLERIDFFLIFTARMGPILENTHMLLGKPEKPNPLNILHIKEMCMLLAAGFAYLLTENPTLTTAAFIGGFFIPDFYFKSLIAERQREIIRNFPAFVDLAALTIESGLDYMGAFERIVQSMSKKTELETEMEKTINEVSLGYARRDALRRMSQRTGLQDVRSFVGLIIQSDELGTSLVDLLRNFSGDMRFRRLNAAEKAAAQAATKMLIPIFIFIFPTVFLLVLGPMLMSLIRKGGFGF